MIRVLTRVTIIVFAFVSGSLAIILTILIGQAIDNAIIKHERDECIRWQQQAIDFADAGFYLTPWQEAQCEAVGFPVKVKEPERRNYIDYLKLENN
jgi:hypothetical protein